VQPWRIFIASGERCQKLRHALVVAATGGQPPAPDDPIDQFGGTYRQLQIECAAALYREMQVERHDQAGRLRAFVRNFEFFDAPHVAMVCMQKEFGIGVAVDVGAWVQTFMLALWARGVASCAQASLRSYPHLVRHELGIPEDLRILCGVSFGYEDFNVPANRTRQMRSAIEQNVTFLDA
jgi:nitroreductase